MKVVRLSATKTGRLYPPGNIPGTHFCQRLSRPQGHRGDRRIMLMKNSNETIGNRTRHFPACSTRCNRVSLTLSDPMSSSNRLFYAAYSRGRLNTTYFVENQFGPYPYNINQQNALLLKYWYYFQLYDLFLHVWNPKVHLRCDSCTYRYEIVCLHAKGISSLVRSTVQKSPAWHTKAAPKEKCCEGYIVPPMVRLMYQLKSVLK